MDEAPPTDPTASAPPPTPTRPRVLARVAARVEDPTLQEFESLHAKLISAEGRESITTATNALLAAGYEVPRTEDSQLKILDHADDAVVRAAIDDLAGLFREGLIRRRPVLVARLKRLEDADDAETARAAIALRNKVLGR